MFRPGSRHVQRNTSISPQHRRRQSLFHDDHGQYRRSLSLERSRRRHRRSRSLSQPPSPQPSTPRNSRGAAVRQHGRDNAVKEGNKQAERAEDRRTKRQRQAAREVEVAQRLREGKKPFYLTLDTSGKPYVAGKPACIAEI